MKADSEGGGDATRECFREISEKIRGMHVEFGCDGTIWLMPDGADMPSAVMWRSCESFLLGDDCYYSVFRLAQIAGRRGRWRKFLLVNRWMILLSSCSSPEELRLMMACIE